MQSNKNKCGATRHTSLEKPDFPMSVSGMPPNKNSLNPKEENLQGGREKAPQEQGK